ncbi:MAG: hypothetical protein F9K16_09405 [Thermoanaerobaculia bacterium]|nr:MAG: hypothetical protein F9K16_09405 [Thermoanaerobaculia bacterium]MBZ0100944.1 hypothetical protein [Thermoanaerobaculia bacterium]
MLSASARSAATAWAASRALIFALAFQSSAASAAPAAYAGQALFLENFECSCFGPWTNGGDGIACSFDDDCLSGHCQNGSCCPAGDCCSVAGDCAGYDDPPVCTDPSTCQGLRGEAVCNCYECSTISDVPDDSACTSDVQAQSCSPYLPVFCNGLPEQSPPACPTSCVGDAECIPDAHCDGTCEFDLVLGVACDEASDCISGFCVDGVCCDSSCGGLCRRCNVAGSLGTCSPISSGTDPDNECGAVSCVGFYWGWSGNSCLRRADVPSGSAHCDGGGACQSQASLCSVSGPGPVTLTCSSGTQVPTPGTCTGTTPGSCTNVLAP